MWFRKTLAVLLIIIFVPIFIITALGWNLKITILNPAFLTKELADNKVYESAVSLASELLVNSVTHGENNLESQGLSNETLKIAFKNAVSANLLQEQAEIVIKAGFAYLYGQTSTIQASINLKPIKENLNNALNKAVEQSFNSLPECKSIKESQSQQNKCRPPGIKLEDLKKGLSNQSGASQFTQMLPDSYDLSTVTNQIPTLGAVKQYFSFYLIGLYVLTAVSALLFALIALMIFSPISSVIKWLATALLVPGIILGGTAFLNLLVSVFIKGSSWSFPTDVSNTINNLISNTAKDVIQNFLFLSGGMIVLAIIFYILAAILRPKNRTEPTKEKSPAKTK